MHSLIHNTYRNLRERYINLKPIWASVGPEGGGRPVALDPVQKMPQIQEWYERTDFATMPGIQEFETIGDLLAQLLRFDPRPTVELMRTVNAAGRAETLAYFQRALLAIS